MHVRVQLNCACAAQNGDGSVQQVSVVADSWQIGRPSHVVALCRGVKDWHSVARTKLKMDDR